MPQLEHTHKYEPAMKAMRVNGQITEVKQLKTILILRWVTIYDPYILSFFSGRNIRQINQILLIRWNSGKNSNIN